MDLQLYETILCLCAQLLGSVWVFVIVACQAPLVHGVFQARILEWDAISFSRGFSQPRDRTCISCISCTGRWILYHCTTWEAPWFFYLLRSFSPITITQPFLCVPFICWINEITCLVEFLSFLTGRLLSSCGSMGSSVPCNPCEWSA